MHGTTSPLFGGDWNKERNLRTSVTDIKFSALGSVYAGERAAYLDRSLASLHRQSLLATEVVVVHDGGLTRGLYSCLKKWRNILPLKEIKLKEPKGIAHALNVGLKECIYGWVARFDTDDINKPERFEAQINHVKNHPDVSMLSSDIAEFKNVPGDVNRIRSTAYSHDDIRNYARARSPMNHSSVIFKKKYPFFPWAATRRRFPLWKTMNYG